MHTLTQGANQFFPATFNKNNNCTGVIVLLVLSIRHVLSNQFN